MSNFKFTKAYIDQSVKKQNIDFNTLNDVKRLERINDNMNGINPFTKKKSDNLLKDKSTIVQNNINVDILKQIKKD